MANVHFQVGHGLDKLKIQILSKAENYKQGAKEDVLITVEEAAVETQDILEAAVTRTGLKREAEFGGLPGRHRSGNMVGSLSYDELLRRFGKRYIGSWGWFPGEFEAYMREQDLGEGDIPAAHALPTSFAHARIRLAIRLNERSGVKL